MVENALGVLSHPRHKCLPLKTLNVSKITLLWSCLGLSWRRCFHPPPPVLESELVLQKLSTVWWRFVAAFAPHSLLLLSVILFLSLLKALCTSTGPGTATCQCNTGWTGDGKACVAIDNCMLESRGNCHINADCVYIGPGQVWSTLSNLMVVFTFPKLLWDGVGLPEVEIGLVSSKACFSAARNTGCS